MREICDAVEHETCKEVRNLLRNLVAPVLM
jgi:hypothetical protein